jgi:hypothetical protein
MASSYRRDTRLATPLAAGSAKPLPVVLNMTRREMMMCFESQSASSNLTVNANQLIR